MSLSFSYRFIVTLCRKNCNKIIKSLLTNRKQRNIMSM
nr:MAG TPA: hypothetical protein [Caudoviricetes sp.]